MLKNKHKNKKGVVFVIIGAFTLAGLLYLMMVFLDFYNLMYTQTVLQGDVRASALHGANYVDLGRIDAQYNRGNTIIMLSSHLGTAPTRKESAEYNAQALFHYNWRNHNRIAKGVGRNEFNPDTNFVRKSSHAAVSSNRQAKLKIKVYQLRPDGSGGWRPENETIDSSVQGTRHTKPGVAVFAEVPVNSWTPFFDGYKIKAYSYATPSLIN